MATANRVSYSVFSNGSSLPLLIATTGAAIILALAPTWCKLAGLLPAVLVVAAIGSRRPVLGIIAAVLIIPFNFESLIEQIGIPFVNPFNLAWVAAIGLLILHARQSRSSFFPRTALDAALVLNIGITTLSVLNARSVIPAHEFKDTFMVFQQWLQWTLFYWVAGGAVRSRHEIRQVTFAIAAMVAVAALFGIKDYVTTRAVSGGAIERSEGLFNQANYAASFFAYYTPFLISLTLAERKPIVRLALLLAAALATVATVVTFGRGGLLALGVGGVLLLMMTRSRALLIGLTIGVVLIVSNPIATERFRSTVQSDTIGESKLDSSTAARVFAWRKAADLIRQRPLFGWGFLTFRHIDHPLDKEAEALFGHGGMDVHNGHLNVAVSGGLLASAVIYFLYGNIIWQAIRIRRESRDQFVRALATGTIVSVVSLLIVNATGTRLYDRQLVAYMWILVAMLFAAHRFERARDNYSLEG
jgi:O-antigen ligase